MNIVESLNDNNIIETVTEGILKDSVTDNGKGILTTLMSYKDFLLKYSQLKNQLTISFKDKNELRKKVCECICDNKSLLSIVPAFRY